MITSLRVIDSHTGGEPTRVVLEGGLPLSGATMAERRADFAARFDALRSAIVNEPRGSEVWVGALLTEPVEPGSTCGVIFFNAVGMLGMCGHGTIGVVETLRHLGRLSSGSVRLDTPVGTIEATLYDDGRVSLRNVKAYRYQKDVVLEVDGLGAVRGDINYGGNWFFIVHEPKFEITVSRATYLTDVCWKIRAALVANGLTGDDGSEIDHVELFTATAPADADSMNFVQCPGGAYDRSPCGTGTSAKLAGLYADGKLTPGQPYRQASVTGSVFTGSVEPVEGGVIPTITGQAYVIADSTLFFSPDDPLREGIR